MRFRYVGSRDGDKVDAVAVKDIMVNGDGKVWNENLEKLPKWVTQLFAEGVFRLSETKPGVHIYYEGSYQWAKMTDYVVYSCEERAVVWTQGEFESNYKKVD